MNYTQCKIEFFFHIHPRTKKRLQKFNLIDNLNNENLKLTDPVSYLEFLNLMINTKFILTDSGGIQEETSYLGIPVLTLRANTERPITIDEVTNELVGKD